MTSGVLLLMTTGLTRLRQAKDAAGHGHDVTVGHELVDRLDARAASDPLSFSESFSLTPSPRARQRYLLDGQLRARW
jgi:hypothetical protein